MDASSNQGINGPAHLQQNHNENPYNDYLNGIQSYATTADNSTNDDFNSFSWDPALFNSEAIGSSYSQQTQSTPSTYTQPISRQSNSSPALPQYQPSQSPYPPQNNYQQAFYDSRNAAQPTFDERFISRPSASPVSFEQFNYQQPMNYAPQSYGQLPQQYQQRQSPAAVSQFPQRQPQPTHHFMNLTARPQSQLSHVQNAENTNPAFQHYPTVQHNSHSFVNPSLLSANGLVNVNGGSGATSQQRQQMQPSQYFTKSGATVDPQLLQPMQMPNQHAHSTPNAQSAQQQQFHQQGQAVNLPPTTKATNGSNGTKAPKIRAPKAKKTNTDQGAGDSDSADELEIEDEPPEMKPALLVVSAPTDIRGKALYNAVQAVWSPRNKSVAAEKVRSGIAAWGETIRSLRDSWKAKNDALMKAELPSSSTAADIPRLKEEVAHYRQVMEVVMSRSLQYGHDSIVKRLGENHIALAALNSFMLDRNRVGDYDSTLASSIFKFAVKFTTMDEEMLETVKWTKILQRFSRKATSDSKDLAKQILANATAQTARKKAAKSEEGPASPGSANGSRSGQGGIKRSRDGDSVGPATKKIVKPASKPLALQHAERRKALERENALKTADKNGKTSTSDGRSVTATNRPKVAMTAPLKSNAFAGLLSASKKPGTSIAEKAALAAKDKVILPSTSVLSEIVAAAKKEEVRKESPPRNLGSALAAKTASSFLGFLADMDKPKESEAKKTEVIPNETEEQREKRLRKEARRRLRVSWKSDDELVETRIFTLDPDEKTGHADSMMRDAGDTVKEGEMLKLHKDVDDLDEDEEEEEDESDDLGEYELPSEIDLSELLMLDGEPSQNYIKTAGPLEPESVASLAQDKYEENTLLAIYVFKSDRPETPKELPSVNDEEDFSPCVDFGRPDEKVLRREKSVIAIRPQPTQQTTAGLDLAAQLRAMTQQHSQPQSAMFNTDLQRTLGMLGQHNQQPTPTPAPTAGGLDIARLMAVVQQAQQVQQVQPTPQYTPAPAPTPSVGIPPNLAALVAQVTGGQQQALPLGNSGNPNPFPGSNIPARKHGRSDDMDAQGNRKKNKVPVDNEGKPLNYRTQVCSYWQEGKCTRGDNCTYRHDDEQTKIPLHQEARLTFYDTARK